jgi:hypothetical protein
MEFGESICNPLLRTAVGVGEATIRRACGQTHGLTIHVELDELLDGREGLRVTLHTPGSLSGFTLLLRKYFDYETLHRAAARAWTRRIPCGKAYRAASMRHMNPSSN